MPRKQKYNGRRRLQPVGGPEMKLRGYKPRPRRTSAPTPAPTSYYKPNRRVINKMNWKIRARANVRMENSDNIVRLPAFKHGKAKRLTFNERVYRIANPPVIYKRNYEWSAECNSGRKGFFGILMNDLIASKSGGGGLYEDIMTGLSNRMTTDTVNQDPTWIATDSNWTQQRFYVDYYSQALNMVNSGTNSLVGKIRIFAYKRDCDPTFSSSGAPMNPLNMGMYGSANGGNVSINGGTEGTLGVYGFNSTTSGVDWDRNYNMPGSAQNPGGATAYADLAFDPMGRQLKELTGYFFKQVHSQTFSLKPGQQIKHTTILRDLPLIYRSSLAVPYIKGTTFYMLIEFNAGIVGDSTAANVISTGSGQLSCMLVEKRIVGITTRQHTKLVMPTTAPAGIHVSNQQTINPDTGVVDIGYDDDA